MGCSACAAKKMQAQQQRQATPNIEINQECTYTIDTINSWSSIFQCVDSKGIALEFSIQRALYNSFMGILISIQRTPSMICTFKKELDIMQTYIINIVNSSVC